MFTLFNVIVVIALALLGGVFNPDAEPSAAIIPYFVYAFAVFLPGLAVTVRRLHDVGKSGWFLLIGFIPFISW